MQSIGDIMAARQQDTLFIYFPDLHWFAVDDHSRAATARQRHFEWFEAHGITWEAAAPRGWLEGDPGIYLLHVEPDDPRITASYTAAFETADGKSLDAEAYQMVMMNYAGWLRAQADQTDS